MKIYDCIVVGGGHAGAESAFAASRMGCSVLLLTMNLDSIGAMSCNPAIGGIGKSQLVREVDALGGLMAKAADACCLQARMLNSSKGPAVRSLRAQQDMSLYKNFIRRQLEQQERLDIRQAEVSGLLMDGDCVAGVRTSLGEEIAGKTVILTTGTFLNGLIHIGLASFPGGRLGEAPSCGLALDLKERGLALSRFKTGTCPRLDGRTINKALLRRQDGDRLPAFFSFSTRSAALPEQPCYITYTNERTHEIIRGGLDRSPLYTGKIKSTGVRYCPSIEDKIVRFSERLRHQIFLEPQGQDTVEVYPNGISTSLPLEIQLELVHSIEGLEEARLTRPGYGIEYDYADPTQLTQGLESKRYRRLFLAGQINGTTGYEEAAAQGLMAGINAALRGRGKGPFVLGRDEAYIGVLIDDLTTRGTNEPYRMFTSRVEYRLLLRQDNADLRLAHYGRELGLLSEQEYRVVEEKKERMLAATRYLRSTRLKGRDVNPHLEQLGTAPLEGAATLEDLLKRPQVDFQCLAEWDHVRENLPFLTPALAELVETEVKYEGFIRRQKEEVERFRRTEDIRIPGDMDYAGIRGLSGEIIEKLKKFQPASLGQASRISGVTPAALSLLLVTISKTRQQKF
ncbi:MAG: tRNA uridine-5-carboxymethylaminomethyl(34) synthesis enzyme MnmG [Candidatus Omnitrophota bacterium]